MYDLSSIQIITKQKHSQNEKIFTNREGQHIPAPPKKKATRDIRGNFVFDGLDADDGKGAGQCHQYCFCK
jgi:hypothetical protein